MIAAKDKAALSRSFICRLILCVTMSSHLASCGDAETLSVNTVDKRISSLLPARVVAGYFPNWTAAPPRIRDASLQYNVIYIFAERTLDAIEKSKDTLTFTLPGDGRGAASHFFADLQFARKSQARKIIISVSGTVPDSGLDGSFPQRNKSQIFVDNVSVLYKKSGGFDGLDWNLADTSQAPDTSEMMWISLELKRRYPGFIITASPVPWNALDQEFCLDMVQRGALDYAAPQYYGGSNLADPNYITHSVSEWVSLLGQSHVVVGFGINQAANYINRIQADATWTQIVTSYPAIRGASGWDINMDERQGWVFANGLGSRVNSKFK